MAYDRRKYDGLSLEEKIDVTLAILDDFLNAFPDGPANHRAAHEAWINAKHAEAEFWMELKLDIAKKGVWGILAIILGLIAVGISTRTGVWFK